MNRWTNFYKQQLLDKIGEEEIFKKYLGRDPLSNVPVTNPLRVDRSPGCNFTRSQQTGRLYFNDYAMERSYDCFAVVMEKYGVSFWSAIRIIEKDFHFDIFSKSKKQTPPEEAKRVRNQVLTYEAKEFSEDELKYWAKYGITKQHLIEYNIISLSKVFINGKLRWESTGDTPIYALDYGLGAVKCYRPTASKQDGKWLSTTTREDVAFYYRIPFMGDLCIITKSFKDALVLNLLGYTSVAPNSESVSLLTPKVRALQQTYDNIVIFYDNDEAGIRGAEKRREELGCTSVVIPKKYEVKDISDFYEVYGEEKTKEFLAKTFKKYLKDDIS